LLRVLDVNSFPLFALATFGHDHYDIADSLFNHDRFGFIHQFDPEGPVDEQVELAKSGHVLDLVSPAP